MISRINSNPLVQLTLLLFPIILGFLTIQPISQFFFPPPIEVDKLMLQISYDSFEINCVKQINNNVTICSKDNDDLIKIVLPADKQTRFELIVFDKEGTSYRGNEIRCRWLFAPSDEQTSFIEPCEKSLPSSNGFSPPYILFIEVNSTGKRFDSNPALTISYNIE